MEHHKGATRNALNLDAKTTGCVDQKQIWHSFIWLLKLFIGKNGLLMDMYQRLG